MSANIVNVMKRLWITTLSAAAIFAAAVSAGHTQEEGIDKAKADAFDARMFAGPPGKKAYACFVRRYDPPTIWRGIPGKRSRRCNCW